MTQLVAAIRRVRRLVPHAREVAVTAHDYDRPGKPVCAWDDPQARQALVSGLVNDALAVLDAVADLELGAARAEAVALLALVAGQDVEPGERPGSWRIARRVAKDRVISTVDPQARHARKTSAAKRDGYKAHVAAEPETGLVTECALTAATAADGPTGVGLLTEEQPGLEVLGDSADGGGETRGADGGWPRADHQAAAACQCDPGRVHRLRLPDRPAGRHGLLPGRLGHADHRVGAGQLRALVPALPAARALHHRQTWPHDPHPPQRGGVARRPPPRDHARLSAQLPALAADGRTLAGLAGRRRLPAGAHRGIERNEAWWSLRVAAVNLRRLLVLGLAHQDGAWVLA